MAYLVERDLDRPSSTTWRLVLNKPICGVEELLLMTGRGQGEIGQAAHSGQRDLSYSHGALFFE